MMKAALLALGFLLVMPAGAAHSQGGPPPVQSLQPTPSACSAGSQSVRVCSDDLRSCNSICTATALDPTADIAGCGLRCCTQFNTCLRIRNCGARVVNCF